MSIYSLENKFYRNVLIIAASVFRLPHSENSRSGQQVCCSDINTSRAVTFKLVWKLTYFLFTIWKFLMLQIIYEKKEYKILSRSKCLDVSQSWRTNVYLVKQNKLVLKTNLNVTFLNTSSPINFFEKNVQDPLAPIQANTRLSKCVYYQWDAVVQRLHVIQRRLPTTLLSMPANGHEALIYASYVLNARGHFDSVVSWDLKYVFNRCFIPDDNPFHSFLVT